MGLIFLIIVIIVVIKLIKLLQRGNSQPSNYSEDYRQGYWDGVRDAQNGCAKIENDNGQVRLITENQSAASRLANMPLNISKNENLDNIIPTSISTAEERVNTVAVPVENNIERTSHINDEEKLFAVFMLTLPIEQAPHIDDKEKERGRKTTINIALYTASLLLTAGILLLAQAINLSIQLRFGLVWLFIFIYYIIGQILYARLPILKSASTALIGTALAAVPIGGWTMNLLLGIDPAWCWLITSVIGAILCVDATVRLNSRPLAYVSLLSMFTMTTSLPAVVHAQLVWYYVVMLLFGCLMTVAAYFSSRLPRQFVEPLNVVNPFIVPMTMFVALSSSAYMGTLDISVLLFASVAYYFTVALVEKSKKMRTYELTTARLLLMVMATSFTMYLSDDNQLVVSVILGLVALGNIIWSAVSMCIQKQYDRHHEIVLWASFAVSLSALFGVIGSGDSLRMMVAFTFIGVISAISLAILFLLRRARFGIMVVISGILLVPIGITLFNIDIAIAPRVQYLIFLFMTPLPVICRLLILKRPNISKSQAALVYGAASTWLLMAMFTSAMIATYATEESLMCLSGAIAIGAGIMSVIVWREKVYEFVVGVHTSLMLSVFLLALGFSVSSENVSILMAWINVSSLLIVEWLYRRHGNTAIKSRELLLYSIIGVAVLIILSSIHPIVWLPLVALLYYAFYRCRREVYLGGAYIMTIIFVLLSLHWLNIPFNDNLAIASWVSLVGFGSLYWMLRMNRQSSIIGDMTLCAATVPAIALPMINLLATYDLSFKVLGWLAAVAALYMAVLAKRDWRIMAIAAHPSLVLLLCLIAQWFAIPLEFMSVVALVVFAVFYGLAIAARTRKMSSLWYYSSFYSAIGWSVVLLSIATSVSATVASVILAALVWIINGIALMFEGVPKKNILYFDSGVILILCGVLFTIKNLALPVHAITIPYLWSAAILSGAVMSWRWLGYIHKSTTVHLVLALSVFSLPTLVLAFAGDSVMEILFLIEHSLMVVVGLVLNKRLITTWGAVYVTLALIYLLSGYTYVLAILAGISIIVAVIIVVARAQRSKRQDIVKR
ncbi:hypothetical protein LRM48_003375 [Candidatus Nanosynbacter sp. TM7-008]|uniref:hypothetical protein n=1 Tax=Candidatus Nanosynbacter sp. TM7-008 TaxID=2902632 RepID=UPI001FB74C63|nr:hypothetical protein [Candidatus Nanosynbacter sp. TM7-008]MCJ1963970.1 hypothetical protein [Candidatus Nanosynbacter sp. TM7-008]